MVVEEHATRIATQCRTDADVGEVGALVDLMESLRTDSPSSLLEWSSSNRYFTRG